ncbi:MAG: TetR/AcrR family transcriptional regulator [bacterium]|nr:TetR/AcrR family transcriptional regulator [bacterium]
MPRSLTSEQVHSFRGDLCAIATRLFAERGFEGVTLRAIAEEMGCSAMTPYRYFENKEEIFEAVRAAAFGRLSNRMQQIARHEPDPFQRIIALAHDYVQFGLDEPAAYRVMFQLDPRKLPEAADAQPESEAHLESGWQTLCDAMSGAVAAGKIHGDPVTLAHVSWVSLHGIVTLHLSGKLNLGRSLDDLVEPFLRNFIDGAKPRSPA